MDEYITKIDLLHRYFYSSSSSEDSFDDYNEDTNNKGSKKQQVEIDQHIEMATVDDADLGDMSDRSGTSKGKKNGNKLKKSTYVWNFTFKNCFFSFFI